MNMYHALTLIALLFVSVPLASAQISNGSFEDFTGETDIGIFTELGALLVDNLGTASSWTFGQDAGIAFGPTTDGNAAAWLNPSTSDGDAVISQIFSIANTGSYSLSWDSFAEEPFDPEPFNGYDVDLSEVGGVSLFSAGFLENPFGGLPTSHSVPFNATSGLYNLTFTGVGVTPGFAFSAGDTFIDNVRVDNITAVPEPGSALIAMLAGLGFMKRNRSSRLTE